MAAAVAPLMSPECLLVTYKRQVFELLPLAQRQQLLLRLNCRGQLEHLVSDWMTSSSSRMEYSIQAQRLLLCVYVQILKYSYKISVAGAIDACEGPSCATLIQSAY